MYNLGVQQYGQKSYCALIFKILQYTATVDLFTYLNAFIIFSETKGVRITEGLLYIAIFGIKRGSAYSLHSTSYEMQNMGLLGDLGADPRKFL